LIEIKKESRLRLHNACRFKGRREPAMSRSRVMQKFALKFLLTSLIVRRGSKRINGAQLAASLLTVVVIVLVGLYVWSHGQY
jgi:hypothetical protein